MSRRMYLILSSDSTPLARGQLVSEPGAETIQIWVLDGRAGLVAEHEIIQLISTDSSAPSLQCNLLRQKDDQIALERMSILDPSQRRDLRVPVKFNTFLYPLEGRWTGRRDACSIDLSCGGIAFYAGHGLEIGERMEIVIPITAQPLIVQIEILRRKKLKAGRTYYTARFVNTCRDEENLLCEAVFSVEVQTGAAKDGKGRNEVLR